MQGLAFRLRGRQILVHPNLRLGVLGIALQRLRVVVVIDGARVQELHHLREPRLGVLGITELHVAIGQALRNVLVGGTELGRQVILHGSGRIGHALVVVVGDPRVRLGVATTLGLCRAREDERHEQKDMPYRGTHQKYRGEMVRPWVNRRSYDTMISCVPAL